ncbi:MAG: DUF1127 domain-containing protein [Rhodospirillales bacterium]|nr:MAG: DUF1127 domain-containing protein [Rhodospirillales bacterium]
MSMTSRMDDTATNLLKSDTTPVRIDPMARLVAAAQYVWTAFIAYRAYKIARARLMALDDRMLRDIGLNRSEIGSVLLDRAGERRNGVRIHHPLRR